MQKPGKTLTQLEDEPQTGFFGCTYSEIVTALKKSVIAALLITMIGAVFVYWPFAAIFGLLVSGVFFMLLIRHAGAQRADNPLFYHRHVSTWRSSLFIQPAKQYQRERNAYDCTK